MHTGHGLAQHVAGVRVCCHGGHQQGVLFGLLLGRRHQQRARLSRPLLSEHGHGQGAQGRLLVHRQFIAAHTGQRAL